MMKRYLMLLGLMAPLAACQAQTTDDELQVREVIARLFKGMEKGDSALVRAVFTPQVTLATLSRDKTGAPVLHRESQLDGFLKAVGTPHKEIWYEETWNLKVQIDGDFAQAWCNYAFYITNTFSHCGVDAFQLHKTNQGWKIFHLADTRRKTDCGIPADIEARHRK